MTLYREPIDGKWEFILPQINLYKEGRMIEAGMRDQIRNNTNAWREISPQTKFYVLFRISQEDAFFSGNLEWALRPYLQGMGYDFASDGPIHLIAKTVCRAYGIDYKEIFCEAYSNEEEYSWIDSLEKDVEDVEPHRRWDPLLALHDLTSINAHSLVELLLDRFIHIGALSPDEGKLDNPWSRVRELAGFPVLLTPRPLSVEELAIAYCTDPTEEIWDQLASLNTNKGTVWSRYTNETGKEIRGPRFMFGVRVCGWEPLPDPEDVLRSLDINRDSKETKMKPGQKVEMIATKDIVVIKNSRQYIDPAALEELAENIRMNGLMQPITVTMNEEGKYGLVMGERRLRAHEKLGMERIAAIVREELTDEQIESMHLAENIQRESLPAIDEAEVFEEQLAEKSIQDLAAMINRSEEYVRRRMKLLHLIPEAREKVRTGAIGLSVAELLSCLPDDRQKMTLAVVEEEGLNAVQLSNLMTRQNDRCLVNAVFDTKECVTCPHNSAGQPNLFAREDSGLGNCLFDPCWSKKEMEKATILAKQIEERGPRAVIAGKIKIGIDDLPLEFDQSQAVMHNKAELGEENLLDCQSCKFLVVFVSTEGHPLRQNICTSRPCYDDRAARFRGENAEGKKSGSQKNGSKSTKENKTAKKAPISPVPRKITPANAPQRVKDFKRSRYQEYLSAHFLKTPENQLRLIILAMRDTSWGRGWNDDSILKEFNLACDAFNSSTTKLYTPLRVLNSEHLMTVAGRMALKALDKFSLPLIEEMIFADLAATPEILFSIDRAYLELLTKAEIEATAKEIGLTEFLQNKGESISKLTTRTKKEFIDGLLACGFTAQSMPAWLQRETVFQNG